MEIRKHIIGVGGVVALALTAAGCTPKYMKQKDSDLAYPGFLDVGAGYTVIPHATSTGKDASGFMVSVKAYPGGRWFAPLKEAVAKQQALDKVELAEKAKADLEEKKTELLDATKKGVVPTSEALTGLTDAQTKVDQTKADVLDSFQALADGSVTKPLYQFKGAGWGKRIFVFYGRSMGGYDEAVDGAVDSLGLGYDITPEFGLVAGHARYGVDVAGAKDTRDALMFGVQLNLSAFKAFRDIGKGGN